MTLRTTPITTMRPIRTRVVAVTVIVTLALGIVAGNAAARREVHPTAANPAASFTQTTTASGRLQALGFTQGQARRLIRQLSNGITLGQRTAAERIATATVWGTADAYGQTPLRSLRNYTGGRLADV